MARSYRNFSVTTLFSMCLLVLSTGCGQDWRAKAVKDVDRMYESLSANHPGAVEGEDSDFKRLLDSNYREASRRAEKVTDSAGYFYALRSFAVPFQDEHLKVNFVKLPDRKLKWPGFAVTTNMFDEVVVFKRNDESAPPIGARLVSCDKMTVQELIAERIVPYVGNWSLPAKRPGDAPYLLIDSQNPFVSNPQTATFEFEGEVTEYELNWRELSEEILAEITNELEPVFESETKFQQLKDGTVWISIASFGVSNPRVKNEIDELVTLIKESRDLIADATALVIDIRGNHGGSTEPGVTVAKSIWGEGFIDRIRPRIQKVDWRASQENLAALEAVLPSIGKAVGKTSRIYREISSIKNGMQDAADSDKNFYEVLMAYPEIKEAIPLPVPANVYFVTDTSCVSAALDFADLVLKIPGVTHVGLETAGDTKYLDTRNEMLPSKLAQFTFPSSAHRGRERKDNESYQPSHRWTGSIADTEGLRKWISELSVRND